MIRLALAVCVFLALASIAEARWYPGKFMGRSNPRASSCSPQYTPQSANSCSGSVTAASPHITYGYHFSNGITTVSGSSCPNGKCPFEQPIQAPRVLPPVLDGVKR